ncbi:MAG: UvrD-helicase domain-containing protein, partial [Leptospirales bacterium]|nr:UvrD-helicase domain-containing protein [Leptospirales bacterium]
NSVFIKTFHSAAAYILRRFGEEIKITKNFTIYDTGDQEDMIKTILIDLKLDPKKIRPGMIASKISEIKDREEFLEGVDPNILIPDYFSFNFKEVFNQYQNKMAANNALDFNDLLCKTVQLLRESKTALDDMQRLWRYFMVDEYQDTNYSQYLITKYLASATKNICVVGDDDQSIYSWRGADIRNILNFERDYDNTKVITLEDNYRSTKQILDAANNVVQNNIHRKNKTIKSSRGDGENITWCITNNEYGESEFVINKIISLKSMENLSNKDFAIFYRTNAQSRIFEDFLRREKIPYRIIGGMKFYDRKEIKDILAYLKFIVNTNDSISLFRIINTPSRGIGKATQDKISENARNKGISEWTVIRDELITVKIQKGTARTQKGLDDFKKIITTLMDDLTKVPAQIKLSEFMTDLVEISGYRENLIEENTLESNSRIDNINELINGIYDYEQANPDATPEQFIQDISLYTSDQNPEENNNCVTLMTVHNAKGLEFPVVFLTGMEENTFPHKLSIDTEEGIEEERRLCYVGLTRAMDRIFITNAELRRSFMGTEYKQHSRFIDEIPREFMDITSYLSQMFERESNFSERFETRSYIKNKNELKQSPTINRSDSFSIRNDIDRNDIEGSGSRFSLRESVVHPEFGVGKIIKIEGSDDNIKLTIDFGTKKRVLMEKYAHLEKLN